MDWNKRREEIKEEILAYKIHKCPDPTVNNIITQEQSMLAKAEEEKKELIEALRSINSYLDQGDRKFSNTLLHKEINQLLQKYSDKKEEEVK